jgi:hypothetical protein
MQGGEVAVPLPYQSKLPDKADTKFRNFLKIFLGDGYPRGAAKGPQTRNSLIQLMMCSAAPPTCMARLAQPRKKNIFCFHPPTSWRGRGKWVALRLQVLRTHTSTG